MTDTLASAVCGETLARPQPPVAVPALGIEALSRPVPPSQAASLFAESATRPQPPVGGVTLFAETLAEPWPPSEAGGLLVEVLRRDTAAAGMVATAYDAFGDAPWPTAQRGVFAFRHDWAEPLVERLEWQTSVLRMASGNEARRARRLIPRRTLTYHVGHGRATDALLADWLADHLGKPALWPLPQHAVRLAQAAAPGTGALWVDGLIADTPEDESAFGPSAAAPLLNPYGLYGWSLLDSRYALIHTATGWQKIGVTAVGEGGLLFLAEPLARSVPAGATVVPLRQGTAVESASLTQHVPGIASGRVTVSIAPPVPPFFGYFGGFLPGGAPALDPNPRLDGIQIWPESNWRDDPEAGVSAAITRQDFSCADPWIRRDDPWPTTTFQRRYLAGNASEIKVWQDRLWRTQGRLDAFWLPDGLAPVLWVTHEAAPDDGYLRVSGDDLSAFWHRPAACLITHPDGTRQTALTATCHLDQGGVLMLRSGLDESVPLGSRVIRLARCRLDHDAVDLYWHTPAVMEITLTARQLPEPRGNDQPAYE